VGVPHRLTLNRQCDFFGEEEEEEKHKGGRIITDSEECTNQKLFSS